MERAEHVAGQIGEGGLRLHPDSARALTEASRAQRLPWIWSTLALAALALVLALR